MFPAKDDVYVYLTLKDFSTPTLVGDCWQWDGGLNPPELAHTGITSWTGGLTRRYKVPQGMENIGIAGSVDNYISSVAGCVYSVTDPGSKEDGLNGFGVLVVACNQGRVKGMD